MYQFQDDLWDDHIDSLLQLPAPELNRFELMDSGWSSDYRWLTEGLFSSMPKLHTLVLRQGFDIEEDYSLLNTVRHIQFNTILFHQQILLILKHSPVLETFSFEMGWEGDVREIVEEVMEELEGKLPVVLPHLKFFEIPSACLNDFVRIFQYVECPSPPRWFVHFCVGALELNDRVLLSILHTLTGYVDGRKDIGDIVSDLYIALDHKRCVVRGRTSGALPSSWHYSRTPPKRDTKLSTFDFSLEYRDKEDEHEQALDEFECPSLDEVVTFAELLPSDDVEKVWISAPEGVQKLATHIVPSWSSLLAQLPNLRTLTLSRSVTAGVLTAFIDGLEPSAETPPPDVSDSESV